MALITENVKKNAETYREYVSKVLVGASEQGGLKNSDMHPEFKGIVEALIRGVVNVAPGSTDFEKVYGQKPYDYFMSEINRYI